MRIHKTRIQEVSYERWSTTFSFMLLSFFGTSIQEWCYFQIEVGPWHSDVVVIVRVDLKLITTNYYYIMTVKFVEENFARDKEPRSFEFVQERSCQCFLTNHVSMNLNIRLRSIIYYLPIAALLPAIIVNWPVVGPPARFNQKLSMGSEDIPSDSFWLVPKAVHGVLC